MDFDKALSESLKDKHTHTDPFLLHSRMSDLVGNDYHAKKAAEAFYRLNAKYDFSSTLIKAIPAKRTKRKKHIYRRKPLPMPTQNTYVFYAPDKPTLHISPDCPYLIGTNKVYRTTFDRKVFFEGHRPHICRHCCYFRHQKATGIFNRVATYLLKTLYSDIRSPKLYYLGDKRWNLSLKLKTLCQKLKRKIHSLWMKLRNS